MVMTIAPFVVPLGSGPCNSNGRFTTPNIRVWNSALFTPINLSMQGVAAHVDATENENVYMLRVELPGFGTDEIDVQVQGDRLTITANRVEEATTSSKGRVSFSRSFTLPEDVKEDDISACLDKGVLTVTLPKAEPTPPPAPKRFTVQAGPFSQPADSSADTSTGKETEAAAADNKQEGEPAAATQERCNYRGWGRCSR